MDNEKKQYPVGNLIADDFTAYEAAIELRDRALKLPFGYKKALKAAKDAIKYKRIFWKNVRKMYPEIKNSTLNYNIEKQYVYEYEVDESL